MQSIDGERAVGVGFIELLPAFSERCQESQQVVAGFETLRKLPCGRECFEHLLFGGKIRFEVSVSGLNALVAEP